MRAIPAVLGVVVLGGGLLAAAPPAGPAPCQAAGGVLQAVRVEAAEESVVVWIQVHGYASYLLRLFEGRPNQVVIDFRGVNVVASAARVRVEKAGVTAVRTGQFEPTTARVVVDLSGEFPPHEIKATEDGFVLRLGNPPAPKPEAPPEKPAEKKAEPPAKPEVKAETTVELPPPVKIEESPPAKPVEKPETKAEAKAEEKKPAEKAEAPSPVIAPVDMERVLKELEAERRRLRPRRFRAAVEGASFGPREGALKDFYGGGYSFGARITYGFAEFAEAWLAGNFYGKTVVDEITGEKRKASLVPIEAGVNFRIARGVVNPYFGVGGGYFQYRDEGTEATIKATKPGFVSQAGVFFKIGRVFLAGVFVKYTYCPIEIGGSKVDVGGFYLGIELGGEF